MAKMVNFWFCAFYHTIDKKETKDIIVGKHQIGGFSGSGVLERGFDRWESRRWTQEVPRGLRAAPPAQPVPQALASTLGSEPGALRGSACVSDRASLLLRLGHLPGAPWARTPCGLCHGPSGAR